MKATDHSLDIEEYLKLICKKCLKANGCCIKNSNAYIGLCAENDREELIELYEKEN